MLTGDNNIEDDKICKFEAFFESIKNLFRLVAVKEEVSIWDWQFFKIKKISLTRFFSNEIINNCTQLVEF